MPLGHGTFAAGRSNRGHGDRLLGILRTSQTAHGPTRSAEVEAGLRVIG